MEREKRMVSKTVTDTDKFLDMPLSAQSLYFHLIMRADDEGFVSNPKKVCRLLNNSNVDMWWLQTKGFIITFNSDVVAIRHWKVHNRLSKIIPTEWQEERKCLEVDKFGVYHKAGEEKWQSE